MTAGGRVLIPTGGNGDVEGTSVISSDGLIVGDRLGKMEGSLDGA